MLVETEVHLPVLRLLPAGLDPGGQQNGLTQAGRHQVLLAAHHACHQVRDKHIEIPGHTATHQLHQLLHLRLVSDKHFGSNLRRPSAMAKPF